MYLLLHLAPALSQEADQQAMLFCIGLNSIMFRGIVLEKKRAELAVKKTIDLFIEGQNWFFSIELLVRPMSSSVTSTSGQSVSCMGR